MAEMRGKDLVLPKKTLYGIFLDLLMDGHGERMAVFHNEKKHTMKDLHMMCQSIAKTLQLRMDHSEVIAILVPPSIHRVASVLGILSIGAAYLPLDTTLPSQRVKAILLETHTKVILATVETAPYMKNDIFHDLDIHVIQVDELNDSEQKVIIKEKNVEDPLVCILYTSGSTGAPKGIKLHQKNVLNRLFWYWDQFPFSDNDIGCHKTSLLFVDALTEILSSVLKGIPLIILDRETVVNTEKFLEDVHSHKVTRLVVVPSLLQAMVTLNELKKGNYFQHLQQIVCSGEALAPELAKEFLRVKPASCSLTNFYGSTETTGDVTFISFSRASEVEKYQNKGYLAIGYPVANTQVYILGSSMEVMDIESEGDICVAGLNVAYGSIGKCDYNIKGSIEGKRVYNTGDKGEIRNGVLYYSGRRDSQIKVRGQRVNLIEIETIIKRLEMIEKVAVIACEGTLSHEIPVAFFSTRWEDNDCERTVEKACKEKLPEYMQPHLFKVEHFPLQAHTGKIDRKKLKDHYQKTIQPSSEGMLAFPQGSEDEIIKILSEVIDAPPKVITRGKCFFALGGNSLSAVLALQYFRKAGFDVTLSNMLNSSDVITYLKKARIVSDGSQNARNINKELENYKIQVIEDNMFKESVTCLLSKEYVTKNPLRKLAGTSQERFAALVDSIFSKIIQDKLSFVMLDKQTGTVNACIVNLDIDTPINPVWDIPAMREIKECAEAPVKQKLQEQGGRWMESLMIAVDSGVESELRLLLLQAMEDHAIRIGRERCYDGIITVNTHPVTTVLVETVHGYISENSVSVKDYQFEGAFPFQDATPNFCIKCMVKYF